MFRKTVKNSDHLRVVSDNPGFVPAVCRGRLGRMREFLKKVRVIDNSVFVPETERLATMLADWVETKYWEYVNIHFDAPEALINLPRVPDADIRKAAVEILKARGYRALFTELSIGIGSRFSVSTLPRSKAHTSN